MTTNSQYQEAQGFINIFNPWLCSYFIRSKLQGLKDKITVKEYLPIHLIQAAIDGVEEIGFFITKRTSVIGIDIDDHSNTFEDVISIDSSNHLTFSNNLLMKYENVLSHMNHYPSLSVLSPHGLHLYWLIDKPLLWENLNLLVKAKLAPIFDALSIELKPTPNITLRIPSRSRIFDPETLTLTYVPPTYGTPSYIPYTSKDTSKNSFTSTSTDYDYGYDYTPTRIDWSLAPIYPAESILGSDYRDKLCSLKFNSPLKTKPKSKPLKHSKDVPSRTTSITSSGTSLKTPCGNPSRNPVADSSSTTTTLAASSSASATAATSSTSKSSLEKSENKILPFKNGESNSQLIKLVGLYKRNKLSVPSMLSRINYHVNQSPQYTGDLTKNQLHLENRIISLSNFDSNFSSLNLESSIPISDSELSMIKTITLNHPFANHLSETIEKYLCRLLRWKKLHDSFMQDPSKLLSLDDIFPYYRKNRLEGYYPLPSKMLQRWNRNYKLIIDWLSNIDILTSSPYPFSPNGKICKYYKINL